MTVRIISLGVVLSVLAACEDPAAAPEGASRPETVTVDAGRMSSDQGATEAEVPPAKGAAPIPKRLPSAPVVPVRRPPPISGGTLAVSEDGSTVVAADPDRDAVFVLHPALGDAVQRVDLEVRSEPGRVAFDGGRRAHVSLRGAGAVARVDTEVGAILDVTPVCANPRGIAYDKRADTVLVGCADGDLVTLSASTHEILGRKFVDLDLRDVLVNAEGRVFVSRYRSAELLELGSGGAVLSSERPPSPRVGRIEFNGDDRHLTFAPTLAWRTTLSANGDIVMVHQRAQDDTVLVPPPEELMSAYGGRSPCDAIAQSAFTFFSAGKPPATYRAIETATLPVDIARSPDGNVTIVAAAGNYLRGGLSTLLSFATDRHHPPYDSGSCLLPSGSGSDGQITAIVFAGADTLYAQSREPARVEVYGVSQKWGTPVLNLQRTIALSSESVRDTGHDLFHNDVGGGLACATCHGESGDDGHVWKFSDIGERRTQTLRGGLSGTAPFHWSGDMKTFRHLINEVMTGRMNGFTVEKPFADELFSWVDQVPALRLAATGGSSEQRGKAIFESDETQCLSCHGGDGLTNSATVDVGTGGAFQVPSLRGLGLRAPYMHDGCAKTILRRFDSGCGGGDKHGRTSQLSVEEIVDLSSYLLTL